MTVTGIWIWQRLTAGLPNLAMPELYGPSAGVYIFDRYDHLISVVSGDENRLPVKLKDVSLPMRQAIVAAEDHRFYHHHGVDPVGMMRALVADARSGRALEGASTLTQQLVKNLYFKGEGRTPLRKLKEIIVAWDLESHYSKDEILEAYLNQVYFGNGAYGIDRAASRYFDKKASQLDLAEAAFLAGLVRAPSELGSPANRQAAVRRQRYILDRMVDYGLTSRDKAELAAAQPLAFKEGASPFKYPYYVSYVMELLGDMYGQSGLRAQGLRAYTNLDPAAQELAERTLARDLRRAPPGLNQAALVSISVPDGAVISMVGGVGDFWKHQFNRATSPHTVGSTFKPFVYLTALEYGTLSQDSLVDDSPVSIPQADGSDYSPRDYDGQFLGPISIRKAIALSRNAAAVRVARAAGIGRIVQTAQAAGVTSPLDYNLSLALGSCAISPLDMASAFSTFARGGVAIRPRVLRKVENWRGDTLATFQPAPRRVFDAEPVAELVDAMQDVVKFGTGFSARLPGRPVAGKTGTTDQARDVWFVGFTPDLVTAVWGGNDEDCPVAGGTATGGGVMAGIWHDYMIAYYCTHAAPPGAFVPPAHPLMPESDFRAVPDHPIMDAIERFFDGLGSPGPGTSSPGRGMMHRVLHRIWSWFQ